TFRSSTSSSAAPGAAAAGVTAAAALGSLISLASLAGAPHGRAGGAQCGTAGRRVLGAGTPHRCCGVRPGACGILGQSSLTSDTSSRGRLGLLDKPPAAHGE